MTTQEILIMGLSMFTASLIFFLLIFRKHLKEDNLKLNDKLDNLKIETRKEFERMKFTEKPICKVGDVYSKKFVVTKAKYTETENNHSLNLHPLFLLYMRHQYELLNLDTKEMIFFDSNLYLSKFIKDNNLEITKIGD